MSNLTIVSIDVETNGRVPGVSSLLQLGAVAFNLEGKEISKFLMNLEPMKGTRPEKSTMSWWATQSKESWERVTKNPKPPKEVMTKFADWISQFPKPLLFAAPAAFDGLWTRWYLDVFVGSSDLWHRVMDMRSVVFALLGRYSGDYQDLIQTVTKTTIENPDPHYALADARYQGQLLFALLKFVDWKPL